ncbi:hypothetical protein ACFL3Z_01475 [Gemmatimonadota bacterium]
MPRLKEFLSLSAIFVTAGCGITPHHFWTYPEPYLPEQQEALLITLDHWGLRAIDGKAVDERICTRDKRILHQSWGTGQYQCIHHLRPGKHVVVIRPQNALSTEERGFTAVAGRAYGLVSEDCEYETTPAGRLRTCRVLIREVKWPGEGGLRPLPQQSR